jgi:hypothetical protein
MAIQHLPRPWLLAALADVPLTVLTQREVDERAADRVERVLPRAEGRRRRLSARHFADQRPDVWYGEDCWEGADQWRDLEADRAN